MNKSDIKLQGSEPVVFSIRLDKRSAHRGDGSDVAGELPGNRWTSRVSPRLAQIARDSNERLSWWQNAKLAGSILSFVTLGMEGLPKEL